MRTVQFFLFALIAIPSIVFGAEINENTLPGRYVIEARAGSKKATFNLNIQNASQFEIQRTDRNPNAKICPGQYRVVDAPNYGESFGTSKRFEGIFTCPDEPNNKADFNITFKNATTRELERGAWVELDSSLAPGATLSAKMKKQ